MIKKWTSQEKNEAIEMLKSGISPKEIAKKLNRSSKSVRVFFYRLGLKYEDFKTVPIQNQCNCCQKPIKKDNKYCSHSCAARINNSISPKRKRVKLMTSLEALRLPKPIVPCLNCGSSTKRIFCCKSCETVYKRTLRLKEAEADDNSLHPKRYKLFLIHKYGEKCMECGWNEKNPLSNTCPIELEHIDENSENNKLENLKLLCPNCHSLTPTYKSLNKGNGRFSRSQRYKDGKSY